MKPKLLHITESFGGGVFVFLENLCNTLCEDFDITLAYSPRSETPADFEKQFDSRVKLCAMRHGRRNPSPLQDLLYFNEIKKLAARVQPDIVHLHSSKAGFVGRMALKRKNNVFYTPHGFAFLMEDVAKWKQNLFLLLEKTAAKWPATTIGVSQYEGETAASFGGRTKWVSNGVFVDQLPHSTDMPASKNLIFGTIARVSPSKNPALFNRIALAFPTHSFVWVGGGELEHELTAPNISVTGWLPRKDALAKLSCIDVFLLPSLWEGLPIAMLEAMAMQKICIALNISGVREVIRHGETGFLVDDFEGFTEVVKNVLSGVYRLPTITQAARADVVQHYNAETNQKQYARIYKEALRLG